MDKEQLFLNYVREQLQQIIQEMSDDDLLSDGVFDNVLKAMHKLAKQHELHRSIPKQIRTPKGYANLMNVVLQQDILTNPAVNPEVHRAQLQKRLESVAEIVREEVSLQQERLSFILK